MEIYREEACQTAEALIEALVKASEGGAALFRGVSDANYTLTPSMYRKEGMARLNELALGPRRTTPIEPKTPMVSRDWNRLLAQHVALTRRFFSVANRRNLIDLDLSRVDFETLDPRAGRPVRWPTDPQFGALNRESFPREDTLPLLALMQHQGLPTPLLDWSEDLLTACFFATDQSAEKLGAEIAIHALDPLFFNRAQELQFAQTQAHLAVPRLYFPSYRGNANLFAQAGAMSYLAAAGFTNEAGQVPRAFDLKSALEAFAQDVTPRQGRDLGPVRRRRTARPPEIHPAPRTGRRVAGAVAGFRGHRERDLPGL